MEQSCSHEKRGNSLATERKASVEKQIKAIRRTVKACGQGEKNRSHVRRRKIVAATRTAGTEKQTQNLSDTEKQI